MVKRVLVAFDFDHTVVDENSDEYILQLLPDGGRLPPSIKKLHSVHGWNDYQREVFRYLHSNRVTKEQFLAFVAKMALVEGMRELLEYLATSKIRTGKADMSHDFQHAAESEKRNGTANGVGHAENGISTVEQQYFTVNGSAVHTSEAGLNSLVDGEMNPSDSSVEFDIIIISDANLVVVNHILETTGLQSVFSKVYTNPSSFDNSGCLQLSPYHRQDWCSLSPANMCKGHILDEHCQKSDVNYDVIAYVGDGANDFCPTLRLRKTDIVFPRRRFPLDKHITRGRDKVAAVVRSWDTGLDIINVLREVLMNVKSSK